MKIWGKEWGEMGGGDVVILRQPFAYHGDWALSILWRYISGRLDSSMVFWKVVVTRLHS
jgi:hypothetical protein